MRRTVPLLALLGLGLLAAPAARAQVRFSVSSYVGVFLYDDGALAFAQGEGDPEDAIRVDPARFLGARVGIRFLERLSLEGNIGFASLSGESESLDDFEDREIEGDLSLYSVALGVDVSPGEKLDLVVGLGVGGATADFDLQEVDSFSDVVMTARLAASYPLVSRVRIRGDVGSVLEFCDRPEEERFAACLEDATLTHVELSGGLQFDFF
ncbi:MAG: outer membrane beta-barrel protein [Gemmatimonadetes bacterium]|nr:outer membrane beta-barrel protein [Gemmatimonadota bacterium]